MTFMGDKGREIYEILDWKDAIPEIKNDEDVVTQAAVPAERDTVASILQKFRDYVAPKTNQIRATVIFNRRTQQETEKFDNFVTDLKRLVKDCGFGNAEERMVRDGIVLRAYHKKVREKCLDKGDTLTLANAITYGQSYDASMMSLKLMTNGERKDVGSINRTDGLQSRHQNKTIIYDAESNSI